MTAKAPKRIKPARKAVKAVRKVPKKRARKTVRKLAPRTIEGERRIVAFRVSTGEKETLEQLAERQGIQVSDLIRRTLTENLDLPEPELKKRRELISG